ncbi:hypothetical protein ACOMHN_049392 [Nucella lapillus]
MGAEHGPQGGDVTSGRDKRCPSGGGVVVSGSGRHGSATVSGGSPRHDVGRPTDNDGRATRGQSVSTRQAGMRASLDSQSRTLPATSSARVGSGESSRQRDKNRNVRSCRLNKA